MGNWAGFINIEKIYNYIWKSRADLCIDAPDLLICNTAAKNSINDLKSL